MADNKFETPEIREYPIIPKLQKGVMSHSKPFIAKEPRLIWSCICILVHYESFFEI